MGKTSKKSSLSRGGLSIWSFKRWRLGLLAGLALALTACGFVPVYQMQAGPIKLRAIDINRAADTLAHQQFERALRQALDDARAEISTDASQALALLLKIDKRNVQVDAQGLAQRIEIIVTAQAQLRRVESGLVTGFVISDRQTIAREASGADQLRDEQIAIELAAEQLAERLLLRVSQSRGAADEN